MGELLMGFFDKVLRSETETVDIEEFLNNMDVQDEVMYEDADAYVKPIVLRDNGDIESVSQELKAGNIILLNIEDLSKRNQSKLRELITSLKDVVGQINGDIARISEEKIIVTPSRVKIVKRRD